MPVVEMGLRESLKIGVTPDDMRAVYRQAFTAALDRYIVRQAATPFYADAHAASNLVYARYFTLLASTPEAPKADDALRHALIAKGLTPAEIDALHMTVAMHGDATPVGPNHMAEYLTSAGVKPTDTNMQLLGRVVAAAYREACLAATEALDLPSPRDRVWALPGVPRKLLGDEAAHTPAPIAEPPQVAPPPPSPPPACPPAAAAMPYAPPPGWPSPPYPVPAPSAVPVASSRIDVTISELATAAIRHRIENKEWDRDRERDVKAALNLFVTANGDLRLSQITQRHCAEMIALFPRLPTRYGHMREDAEGGMFGVLQRGDELRRLWKADPQQAERDKLPTVGLGDITHNKHLHWLGCIFAFGDAHDFVVPPVELSKLRRKIKAKKGGRRLPWTVGELQTLMTGPVWTGCAGLWDRFKPGNVIIHDGTYWGLPLAATTGARSEEFNGLMLADIFGVGMNGRAEHKEAMQRAIARIEHAQGLRCEDGARYAVVDEHVVRLPTDPRPARSRAPLRQEVLAWEAESGFASFTRVAQNVAGPFLDTCRTWSELHRALAPHGIGIRPKDNGGELHAGDEHVKLSNVDRRHSWTKLIRPDRLGPYQPPRGITPAPYVPHVTDERKARRWLDRQDRQHGIAQQVDARIAGLIAARNAALADLRRDFAKRRAALTAFDSDPRLKRDLTAGWSTVQSEALAAVAASFAARIAAVRGLRGALAVESDLSDLDGAALGTFEAAIVLPWHGAAPPAAVALAHFTPERSGEVVRYWLSDDRERYGRPALVDTGNIVWVNDRSDAAIAAALSLAAGRSEDGVAIFGDSDYLARCRRIAAARAIEVEVISVADARQRARRQNDRRRSARIRALGQAARRAQAHPFAEWVAAFSRTRTGLPIAIRADTVGSLVPIAGNAQSPSADVAQRRAAASIEM